MRDRLMVFMRHNATALLALCVALGGVSYAAVKLPKNSVGTKQIRNNAVAAKKIRKNAVNSAKVRDGSLLKRDFKAGQLPSGPTGPTGPRGATGEVDLDRAGIVAVNSLTGGEVGATENSGSTKIGELTFDAPAAGAVLVTLDTNLHPFAAPDGTCSAEIRIEQENVAVGDRRVQTFRSFDNPQTYRSVGTTAVKAVGPGETTFEGWLRINPNVSPSCDGYIMSAGARMTAQFFPFLQEG